MYRQTKVEKVTNDLDSLKIGQTIDKKELIKKHWGHTLSDDDYYFLCRSFDVAYHNAKKLLSSKKFRIKSGMIERVQFQDASEFMTAERLVLTDGTEINE